MTRQVGDGVNVLIETSWNVKDESVGIHSSINRNIVECKGKTTQIRAIIRDMY